MKRFLVIFLSLLLVFLSISVNGVTNKKNYLEGLTWDCTFSCSIKKAEGLSVEATSLTKTFSSPAIDIASAIKKAFNENPTAQKISFTVGGKVMADFKDNKETSFNAKLTIRAKTNLTDGASWKKTYEESLNGDTPFFSIVSPGTNALKHLSQGVTVKSQWSNFTAVFTVTKNNAFSSETPNWYLCIDGIKLDKNPQTIYFKDMFLEVKYLNTAEEASPTSTANIPPRVTPSRTLAPLMTPSSNDLVEVPETKNPTPTPVQTEIASEDFTKQPLFEDSKNILSLCFKGTITIIIFIGFLAIILNLFKRSRK